MAAPPRLFKLLEEHEGALHGDVPAGVTLGVTDPKTQSFEEWTASIMGQFGTFEGRFLNLKIVAGDAYPSEPPVVRFIQKVNLPGVDATGLVDVSSL